jgi:hypothetical protein
MPLASPARILRLGPARYWCQPHWVQSTELALQLFSSVGHGCGDGVLVGAGAFQ